MMEFFKSRMFNAVWILAASVIWAAHVATGFLNSMISANSGRRSAILSMLNDVTEALLVRPLGTFVAATVIVSTGAISAWLLVRGHLRKDLRPKSTPDETYEPLTEQRLARITSMHSRTAQAAPIIETNKALEPTDEQKIAIEHVRSRIAASDARDGNLFATDDAYSIQLATELVMGDPPPKGSTAYSLLYGDDNTGFEKRSALPKAIKNAAFQAVLFKQHMPPRFDATSRSWFGGLPLVEPSFVWPQTQYADKPNKPLSFVMQIDCAEIPESALLGLMPDHGMLQFFVDMDWGNGFGQKVLWCGSDASLLQQAIEPADLQPVYGEETQYFRKWHAKTIEPENYLERTLPRWTFHPMAISIPKDHYDEDDEDGEPIYVWKEEALAAIAWDKQGDTEAIYKKQDHYNEQRQIVRPFPTFPHNWRAVQICAGLMLERRIDKYAIVDGKKLYDLPADQQTQIISSIEREAEDWFAVAAAQKPFDSLKLEESDIFWTWFAGYPEISLYFIQEAVTMAIEDTVSESPETAAQIPAEALHLLRNRHVLVQKSANGFTNFTPARMLAPPCAVQFVQSEMALEHILLLQLSANEGLGQHLGEGVLQFWIKPEDLEARRFDQVLLTAEAY